MYQTRPRQLLIAATLLMLESCNSAGPGSASKKIEPPPVVAAAPLALHDFVDALEAVGQAKSAESVVIAANLTERVKALHFNDGAVVSKGQILVELAQAEQNADVAGAEASLRDAEAKLARIQPLIANGFATQAQLDQALATRDAARATLLANKSKVADRVIRAPFSGIVGLRSVSAGLIATSGTPILQLDDISTIKLDFPVPETALASIRRGLPIIARAAAFPEERFTGRISSINTNVDPVTRSTLVRALIPNPQQRLKPGMLITVQVVRAARRALAAPEQALVQLRDQQALFVLNRPDPHTGQAKASRAKVHVGQREPGWVEITNGVAQNALIVTEGTLKVRDGATVQVVSAGSGPA